jgi:uncharacterized membrane protein YqhA
MSADRKESPAGEERSAEPGMMEAVCKPRGSFFVNTIAAGSSWLFLLAVIGSALISVALFVFGFGLAVFTLYEAVLNIQFDLHVLKGLLAISIEIIDIFLVATVFYIVALGLYELFIAKAPLPGWLKICDLDDLKEKVLGLVTIALAVLFLGDALTWEGTTNILAYGAAIGAVIISLSVYMWVKH